MGADLFFQVKNRQHAEALNEHLLLLEEGVLLSSINRCPLVVEQADIEWARSSPECPEDSREWFQDEFNKKRGRGTWKASGILPEEVEPIGCRTLEEFLELVCRLFCKANKKFDLQYYAGSCAFTADEDYFSIDQMKRMTQGGKRLTKPKGERAPKYDELMEAMKGEVYEGQ